MQRIVDGINFALFDSRCASARKTRSSERCGGKLACNGSVFIYDHHATAATLIYRIISFVLITAIGWVVHVICYAGRGYMLGAPRD